MFVHVCSFHDETDMRMAQKGINTPGDSKQTFKVMKL